MAIKVEIKPSDKKEKCEYPCIKFNKSDGVFVLFVGKHNGIALNETNTYALGCTRNCWFEESFEKYEGEITLSND